MQVPGMIERTPAVAAFVKTRRSQSASTVSCAGFPSTLLANALGAGLGCDSMTNLEYARSRRKRYRA